MCGCSLQQPLSAEAASQLNGRWLSQTERRTPSFVSAKPMGYPMAAAGAAAGLTGAFTAAAFQSDAGAQVLAENHIPDPARAIARQLSARLEQHFGLHHASRPIWTDSDDATKLAAAEPTADLVIDVWTESWSLSPTGEDLSKLHVQYAANMRLIDARVVHTIDGKRGLAIAEGTCERSPEEPASALTREQLLADGARLLKAELEQAVRECVRTFRTQLLQDHLSAGSL